MGNACCAHQGGFTAMDFTADSGQLIQRLRERPGLLSRPRPAALLGLNDSALHMAAEHKSLDAAQQIFSFLTDADQETLQAALLPYCRHKRLQLPSSPLGAARLVANMLNNKGQTPLMHACYSDCPEVTKLLLEQGADPWVGDNCGSRNALHYAAMAGSAACVEALMKHTLPHMLVRHGGRYINSRSLSGLTPLHYCVFFTHEAALEQLLLYEPNINAASTGESYDTYGSYDIYSTPLHFAAFQGSAPMARLLLLHYARRRRLGTLLDPRLRANSAGQLPWQVAHRREVASLLHPAASLGEVLGREGEEALLGLGLGGGESVALGPPCLAALAAAALRQLLLAEVEVIERECVEEAALQRQQSTRPGGLLACATPRRSAAVAPSCGPGAVDLLRLASRRTRSSRRTLATGGGGSGGGSVMPLSPRRAPTLDRLPHPSDFTSETTAAGGAEGGSPRAVQQRSRLPSPHAGGLLSPSSGAVSATTRGAGGRGGASSRGQSGRTRGQQLCLTSPENTAGFLGAGTGGAGERVSGPSGGTWDPGLASANGGSAHPVLGGGGGGGGGHLFPAAGVIGGGAAAGGCRSDIIATLPGCASPISPHLPGELRSRPSMELTPAGSSPTRSVVLPCGGSDDGCRLTATYGGNVLSPAASLVAGSYVDFDVAAAAIARAAAVDEGGGEETDGNDAGGTGDGGGDAGGDDDDDEDGTCNVCFARPEAVMAAACRHGLCTACAGEMCRALLSKPLLCPFCRRPVGRFLRSVKPPPPPPPASARRR